MSEYLEFKLDDGSTVILECDVTDRGITKAGVANKLREAAQSLEEAAETASKSAMGLLKKLRGNLHEAPDEIEITFGLKATAELNSVIIAKAGVEANYSVKMTWKSKK